MVGESISGWSRSYESLNSLTKAKRPLRIVEAFPRVSVGPSASPHGTPLKNEEKKDNFKTVKASCTKQFSAESSSEIDAAGGGNAAATMNSLPPMIALSLKLLKPGVTEFSVLHFPFLRRLVDSGKGNCRRSFEFVERFSTSSAALKNSPKEIWYSRSVWPLSDGGHGASDWRCRSLAPVAVAGCPGGQTPLPL